ncbi:MAG: hypothetical protein ACYTBX_02030 [Planctomycetota bacterium]|jgi:hypothetical protein
MRKLSIVWACFVLAVFSPKLFAYTQWSGSPEDTNWNNPNNWDGGVLPTNDKAGVKTEPVGPIIVTGDVAVCRQLTLGGVGGGTVTINGGVLNIAQYAIMGNVSGEDGTLILNSGQFNAGTNFYVGFAGTGTAYLNGGTVSVGTNFGIGDKSTGIGTVYLGGSVVTCTTFRMDNLGGATAKMDIAVGTLIVDGDETSKIQTYIDNGWITSYGGNGTLQLDYNVTNEGKTTLKAVHLLNPNPADGGLVSPGEVELSWTLPDPCVPGQPVLVDVYFTDDLQSLEYFTDPAAIQVVSKQNVASVVVQTQPKTQYYWAIDTYIGDPNDPIFGPIFSFFADNQPPKVDAGANIVTWLQDGSRTGNLDATVTYDDAYTVQWTVVSEPSAGAAVIETATAEDASITLAALGEYVLQLEAFDGEYTSSDTVTINVYSDSCEAAQSLPDYEPLVGDLNGDCVVDDVDIALLQENWLQDNSLTEDWFTVD